MSIADAFPEVTAAQLPEFLNRGIALAKELIVLEFRGFVGESCGRQRAPSETPAQQPETAQNPVFADGSLRITRTRAAARCRVIRTREPLERRHIPLIDRDARHRSSGNQQAVHCDSPNEFPRPIQEIRRTPVPSTRRETFFFPVRVRTPLMIRNQMLGTWFSQ